MRTRGEELSTCPGYSTSLPMVGEVVEAYPHWEAGTLTDLIGGAPSRALLLGLSALKAGHAERSRDILDERKAGG